MFQARPELPEIVDAHEKAPNVLIIVLDTIRPKNMSMYGYHRNTTPRLDEFSAGAVVFERAMATSPWTLPSHGSMFTGPVRIGALDELAGAPGRPLADTRGVLHIPWGTARVVS